MKMKIIYIIPIFFLLFMFSCSNQKNNSSASISLYAAISTKLALDSIINNIYTNTNLEIKKNYASSGILARQIINGAKPDIFISADKEWIDLLINNKLLNPENVKVFAKNQLVIARHFENNKFLNEEFLLDSSFDVNLFTENKLCIADPKHVPLGKYSKQMLEKLNWFEQLKGKMILAKDASAVVNYLSLGECDWAIIYKSDLYKSKNIKFVKEVGHSLHNDVILYIALINLNNEEAVKLFDTLLESKSKNILKKYGFEQ